MGVVYETENSERNQKKIIGVAHDGKPHVYSENFVWKWLVMSLQDRMQHI